MYHIDIGEFIDESEMIVFKKYAFETIQKNKLDKIFNISASQFTCSIKHQIKYQR